MKMDYIDHGKVADNIEEIVLKKFRKDFEAIELPDEDFLQSLYIRDAADMLRLCGFIRRGMFEKAKELSCAMDTSPREKFYSMVIDEVGEELADKIV